MKTAEMKKWSEFTDKAKANEWSLDRIERESQKLQKEMDRHLAYEFGLNRSLDQAWADKIHNN